MFLQLRRHRIRTSRHFLRGNNPTRFVDSANRGRFLRDIKRGLIGHGSSPFNCQAKTDSRHVNLGNRHCGREGDTPRLR